MLEQRCSFPLTYRLILYVRLCWKPLPGLTKHQASEEYDQHWKLYISHEQLTVTALYKSHLVESQANVLTVIFVSWDIQKEI